MKTRLLGNRMLKVAICLWCFIVLTSSQSGLAELIEPPFLYENGQITYFGRMERNAAPADINDRGQVVANSFAEEGFPYQTAFLWENGEVDYLGRLPGDNTSGASAINNKGQIVGISGTVGSGFYDACLWENGTPRNLGVYGWVEDINDDGQIVGGYLTWVNNEQAWRWEKGSVTRLGSMVEGQESVVKSINNHGGVVGCANVAQPSTSDRIVAFSWKNGQMEKLDCLPEPTSSRPYTQAYKINERGQVVGWAAGEYFLWMNEDVTWLPGIALDVNDLGQVGGQIRHEGRDRGDLWEDGELTYLPSPITKAIAINNEGQIVGTAVPESATMLLLGTGLIGLGVFIRKLKK